MGACARNMQSDPAEIKPAQCCIKLVFHLTATSDIYFTPFCYLHPSSRDTRTVHQTIICSSSSKFFKLLFVCTPKHVTSVSPQKYNCKKTCLIILSIMFNRVTDRFRLNLFFYRCTVNSVIYLITLTHAHTHTHTQTHTHIYRKKFKEQSLIMWKVREGVKRCN